MDAKEVCRYRALAAGLMWLTTSARTWHSRVVKLECPTSMVQQFNWAGHDTNLQCYTDSDWAGDRQNMKSASDGVIMWSEHCTKL